MRLVGVVVVGVLSALAAPACRYDRDQIPSTQRGAAAEPDHRPVATDGSTGPSSALPRLLPSTTDSRVPASHRPDAEPVTTCSFASDGGACVPPETCTELTCDPMQECFVTATGPTCGACPTGYEDVMGACTDIDECEDADACDPHRACSNTLGAFACGPCENGYTAVDGARCVNIDECAQPDACPPHRPCVDTEGDYRCDPCMSGFDDVSGVCQDVDECKNADACASEAFCSNSTGAYSCRCPAYYLELDAGQTCEDTRLRWLSTLPLVGVQAMPFGPDLLLAGTFDKELTIDGRSIRPIGDRDVFIARLDQERQLVWLHQYGGLAYDRMLWANVDTKGNVLTTGFTDGGLDLGAGPIDAHGSRVRFVAKFGAEDGLPMWSHTMVNVDIFSDNWEKDWEGYVSADVEDNVLLCGRFQRTTQLGPVTLTAVQKMDAFVAKIAPDGAVLWAESFGGSGDDQCRAVHADAEGNVVAAGLFEQTILFGTTEHLSAGSMDVFLAKLDPNGQAIWSRQIGGTSYDEIGRLALDGDGNPIIAGDFWGSVDFGTQVLEAVDWDAWLAKWSAQGEPLWSKRLGGVDNDVIWGVASGPSNEIAVVGFFTETIDFGEGERKSSGMLDAFVAKYSARGTLIWSRDFGGSGWDTAAGVRLDELGAVHATGWFEVPLDLGRGPTSTSGMYLMELAP